MSPGFGQKNMELHVFMYADIHEHSNSEENEGEIPLVSRHNNSEGKIYTHFMVLVFNKS